ncbi:uncharacterized protein LOC114657109 isoform X2 [Erpetoichthys calabaricus]|uniref:uncharacterized protein LOC114657109 isoform X2 n=1 Tax=Erpetoichthys calabaricus TaxID=27687 RepID=UPI0022343C4C|nr:uncharacterized protein LOC114657109 isoform X2 [Erpetoichthys calabaricus]
MLFYIFLNRIISRSKLPQTFRPYFNLQMCFCAFSVIHDCILHARIYEQMNTCEITAEQQFRTEAVVSRKVSSKWLKNYENPKGHRVMTYIEDEELIDGLYNFLDEVLSRAVGTFERIDRVGIILDVLIPELYKQMRGFLCQRQKICSWMDQQTVSGTSCGK